MSRVLIKRQGALGDVLLVTPIIKRLTMEGHEVGIETSCFQALERNPDVKWMAFRLDHLPWDRIVDLNMVYENQPEMHIVDAYSIHVFGDTKTPRLPIYYPTQHLDAVKNSAAGWEAQRGRFTAIHAAKSWPNRTMSRKFWDGLVDRLNGPVLFLGGGSDYCGPNPGYSEVGRIDLGMTASIIDAAGLFIGSDSALLHVAASTQVPMVGIFTCTDPTLRMPDRPAAVAVNADIDCFGCHHRLGRGVTSWQCHREGGIECINRVSYEAVQNAIKECLL